MDDQPAIGSRGRTSAHDHAINIPIQEVVRELVDLLGATAVAVIGGVGETRAVAQWMKDREPQRPHVLRFALQLATTIGGSGDRQLIQAWFHSANPGLGDVPPILALRNRPLDELQGPLLAAARNFSSRREAPPPEVRPG
jgi:hypothetical protein